MSKPRWPHARVLPVLQKKQHARRRLKDGSMDVRATNDYSPYHIFTRAEWASLRDDTPMTLTASEVAALRSLHDRLDIREVEEIYLPLSRLLSLYVAATRRLFVAQRNFLHSEDAKVPYIIGV